MTVSGSQADSPFGVGVPVSRSGVAAGATNGAPGHSDLPKGACGSQGAAERLHRTVRERIRAERVSRGWTQAELAAEVGISHTTVSHWETGARPPGLDDIGCLAAAFGVDPWSLILPGGFVLVSEDDDTVERVARAIHDAGCGTDDLCKGYDSHGEWDRRLRDDSYEAEARAAVQALRDGGAK